MSISISVVFLPREIYYRDPDLFQSQGTVDAIIDDIACSFSVSRSDLNVEAGAKGLVYGWVRIILTSGHFIDCLSQNRHPVCYPRVLSFTLEVSSLPLFLPCIG